MQVTSASSCWQVKMPLNLHACPPPLLWHEKQSRGKQLNCQASKLRHTKNVGALQLQPPLKKPQITKIAPDLLISEMLQHSPQGWLQNYQLLLGSINYFFWQFLLSVTHTGFCSWRCLITEKFGDLKATSDLKCPDQEYNLFPPHV